MKLHPLKKRATKAIGEVFLITIGILGAFAIEDWQEEEKIQRLTTDTLDLIFTELADNRCALEESHEHHTWVRDTYKEIGSNPTEEDYAALQQKLYRKGIIKLAELLSLAWETAVTTGAMRYIDLKDGNQFSRLYHRAEQYRRSYATLDNAMTQVLFEDISSKEYIRGIMSGVDDLWWIEKYLLSLYQKQFAPLAEKYGHQIEECV